MEKFERQMAKCQQVVNNICGMINLQHINPVLDDANGILVDPQHLNDPVNLGDIESSIVVTDKKLLKLDMNFIKLQPPVRKLRTD